MGNGIHIVFDAEFAIQKTPDIIDILFGFGGNTGHRAHGQHRMFSGGGFSGKHDGRSAIVHRIGHIGDFGSGGAGIGNHGFQHFGCGDHPLTQQSAGVDQLFLNGGKLFKGNLHAHIASSDHNAVAL